MHRLLERERLETYAEALVTGTTAVLSKPETSPRRTQLTPIWCCCCTAGREQDKRRPHELETLEELIEKEVKLTAWGRSVKRQNGLGKKNAHVQRGAGVQGGDAEEEEKGEDSGRGKSSRGKKGRKGKKNKGRRDDEHY
jgi:hypothetical protein